MILNKLNEILSYIKDNNPSRYIDIREVSNQTNLSKSTLRRAVQTGELKCSKKTGKLLFKVEDVERWLNG